MLIALAALVIIESKLQQVQSIELEKRIDHSRWVIHFKYGLRQQR